MEETIFWFFVSKGYTKVQAAGILGNMLIEAGSGLDPRKVEYDTPNSRGEISKIGQPSSLDYWPASGGYGLVQWTPGTKMLPPEIQHIRTLEEARQAGITITPSDLGFQLNLIYEQLEGRSHISERKAGIDLKKQTTVRGATVSFMLEYERPRDQSLAAQDKRVELAERVYENFSGAVPPAGVTVAPAAGHWGNCPPTRPLGADVVIDGFVVYSQTDPAWRDKPYGTSTIGRAGCGPSAVAMVVSTFLGRRVTPVEIAARFGHFYIEGIGSDHQLMFDGPEFYGLTVTRIGDDMQRAVDELKAGSLILATGKGAVPFTAGGHIIVLRGVTTEGKILVGDSGHAEANHREWSPEELLGVRDMWAVRR
jgi:hypothetical protein